MIPVFADTFYCLALLHTDDSAHEAAKAISIGLRVRIITTAWVLAEVANTFSAAYRRCSVVALFEAITNDPDVTIVPPSQQLFEAGVEFYARHDDKDWSLTDCISFLVTKEHGILDVLTGDHHFEQAGFRALLK
jgi:hypothetical protein